MPLSLGIGFDLTTGGGASGSLPLAFNALTIGEGDSLMAQIKGTSTHMWAAVASNGALQFVSKASPAGTAATGGAVAADIESEAATLVATYSPELVILCVGTNDTNVTVPFSAAMASVEAAIDTYNAGGAMVVVMLIPQRADAPGKAADRAEFNEWISSLRDTKDLLVFDPEPYFDPADPVQSADGLHPLTPGAATIGKALGLYLRSLMPPGDVYAELAGPNLVSNPTFQGTDGSVFTGLQPGSYLPTSYRIDNDSGVTASCAVVEDDEGVRWIRIDVSGTGTSGTADFYLDQLVVRDVQVGDEYDVAARIRIGGAGGVGAPVGLKGWEFRGFNARIFDRTNDPGTAGYMDVPVDNLVRCLTVPATEVAANSRVGFFCRWHLGPVSARIEIALPHCGQRP